MGLVGVASASLVRWAMDWRRASTAPPLVRANELIVIVDPLDCTLLKVDLDGARQLAQTMRLRLRPMVIGLADLSGHEQYLDALGLDRVGGATEAEDWGRWALRAGLALPAVVYRREAGLVVLSGLRSWRVKYLLALAQG